MTSSPSTRTPKSPKLAKSGFGEALAELANSRPDDWELRGAARTYIAMKQALGCTTDPRATASWHLAQAHYKRVTGSEWSGNP